MTSDDGKSMRSLCCDLDHYVRCITEFESRLAWLLDFEKWVRDFLGEKVLDQVKLPRLQEGSPLRMLGVGIGRGNVESNLTSRLLAKFPDIVYTVVEPSNAQLDLYRKLIKSREPEFNGVEHYWHTKTLSQFASACDEVGDTTKFHFISALFCLYYEQDMESLLAYLYDRLEPGGVLLAALETEKCDYIKIEDHFKFAPDELNPFWSAQNITDFCLKNKIPFVVHRHPDNLRRFEITPCFDDSSPEGALLLDFLSSVINFRNVVSPDVLQEFRDYLKDMSSFKDGKAYLLHDSEYLIMHKS